MLNAVNSAMYGQSTEAEHFKDGKNIEKVYYNLLVTIECLHRRLTEVIRHEFERVDCNHVSPVQGLLLCDIGHSEVALGDLRDRGCYLGSSMSYNLKKMIDGGYVKHERSKIDRRSIRLSLTEKGKKVTLIIGSMYGRHLRSLEEVSGVSVSDLHLVHKALRSLDRFWMDQVLYRL